MNFNIPATARPPDEDPPTPVVRIGKNKIKELNRIDMISLNE